jgi:hypothetical protein
VNTYNEEILFAIFVIPKFKSTSKFPKLELTFDKLISILIIVLLISEF